jgi:NitT/TauT family transport system substrate-binding protein
MKKRIIFGSAVIVGIVFLLSIWTITSCNKSKDTPKETIRVAYLPILVCSPFFVAEEKGYFTEQHLDIVAQKFVSSNQIAEAMLAGKTDAAMSLAQSVAVTIEAKQPGQMKVFMANAQNSKEYLSSLVVKRDSPIRNVADLKGKKIGCFPGQTARVYLSMTLEKYGIDPEKDVQIQQISPAAQLQALEVGSIDALLCYEPVTTIGIEKGLVRPLIQGAFEKNVIDPWVGGVFTLRAKFIKEHPALARKFVRALDKAVDYINAHPDEYKLILAKYMPIDENIARKTTNIPYWKLSEIDRDQIQKQTDLLAEKGVLPQKVDTRGTYYRP